MKTPEIHTFNVFLLLFFLVYPLSVRDSLCLFTIEIGFSRLSLFLSSASFLLSLETHRLILPIYKSPNVRSQCGKLLKAFIFIKIGRLIICHLICDAVDFYILKSKLGKTTSVTCILGLVFSDMFLEITIVKY